MVAKLGGAIFNGIFGLDLSDLKKIQYFKKILDTIIGVWSNAHGKGQIESN